MSILMTGATGILGSAIGLELEDDVYYLVREGTNNKRLPSGISPDNVITSDITKPLCGLSQADINKLNEKGIDRFLHLAANVSFATEDTDGSIWKTNFEGTKNAIELTKKLNVKEFLHCSTAYAEDKRNPYEKSKLAAEELVKKSGFLYSIFRPSAMVGDSRTGYTSDFNGYYGAYSIFHLIAQKKRSIGQDEEVLIPIYLVVSSTTTLNIIPLDWVKYIMLALIKKKSKNEIYHIAHDNPPKARWVGKKSFSTLSISGIKYWESVGEKEKFYKEIQKPSFLQRQVDIMMNRYIPYTTQERRFSLDTVETELGVDFIHPPIITIDMLNILLKYAVDMNFGHERKEK